MDIFLRFKKDYLRYFLGIILPAGINGVSIPLLKHLIGAEDYGRYALYFNALLIANVVLSGWLSQSILRFNARVEDKARFAVQCTFLGCLVPLLFFIPVLWTMWQREGIIMGIVFAATLVMASLQLPLQSLTQANFRSTSILLAEAIRTGSWLLIAVLLLGLQIPFLYALFTALFVSYTLSTGFLYKSNGLHMANWSNLGGWQSVFRQLLQYGLPLSLWFAVAYLVIYIDKLYMLHRFGAYVQGNYNALFDFISRGLVLLLAPVLTSAAPLLSEAYEKGEKRSVRKLLRRLMLYELLALVVLLAGYFLAGYRLLFYLLHIPNEPLYIATGACIIVATLTWQLALLAQKPFELRLHSAFILWRAMAAFGCQVAFYFFTQQLQTPLLAPAGFLVAALVYLGLVLLPFRKKV